MTPVPDDHGVGSIRRRRHVRHRCLSGNSVQAQAAVSPPSSMREVKEPGVPFPCSVKKSPVRAGFDFIWEQRTLIMPNRNDAAQPFADTDRNHFIRRAPLENYAMFSGKGRTSRISRCSVANITKRSNPRATPEHGGRPDCIAASNRGAPGSFGDCSPMRR